MNDKELDQTQIAIPLWFRWINSGVMVVVLTGGVPWATWVSYTLITIQQMTSIVPSNMVRITEHDRELSSHAAQFQVIAATRFSADQGRAIQTSIDRLDMKIESMTRDISDLRSRPQSRPGEQNGQPPGVTTKPGPQP